MSPTLILWHLSISCHSLCLSIILSLVLSKCHLYPIIHLIVYFKYTESLGIKNLSFLKSNKANTYSIAICIAYMYKWSFIDLAYTAGARYLHSGKRGPDICSVQEVRYLLRRWWTTGVQNKLKSIDQIISVL